MAAATAAHAATGSHHGRARGPQAAQAAHGRAGPAHAVPAAPLVGASGGPQSPLLPPLASRSGAPPEAAPPPPVALSSATCLCSASTWGRGGEGGRQRAAVETPVGRRLCYNPGSLRFRKAFPTV
jgi:hypothetical protein